MPLTQKILKPQTPMLGLIMALLLMTLGVGKMAKAEENAPSSIVCRLKAPDVGNPIGHGRTLGEAFKQAVQTCTERREAQYVALRGPIDIDRYEDFAVACANTPCETP